MLTAIIPARGGSKGVPRKNLATLTVGGKSLVEIAVAKCLAVADNVIVSSDDAEILRLAGFAGAELVDRPAELATDTASGWDVIRHVRDRCGVTGRVLLVQCTAPLVEIDDLVRCDAERGDADLGVLCHKFHGFVLQGGECVNHRLHPPQRRQELPTQYLIAGSAWSFDAGYLDRGFYSGNVKPIVCPGPYCDIDTMGDMEVARAVYFSRNPVPYCGELQP